jgi:hypothetical protein
MRSIPDDFVKAGEAVERGEIVAIALWMIKPSVSIP